MLPPMPMPMPELSASWDLSSGPSMAASDLGDQVQQFGSYAPKPAGTGIAEMLETGNPVNFALVAVAVIFAVMIVKG